MGKATAGRKRTTGDRYPSGKLMPEYDRGCDGVQRRIALYAPANDKDKDRVRLSTETFDAIGRAMVNGLLDGRDTDPAVLCTAGRDYIALALRLYGVGSHKDSLGQFQPQPGGGGDNDGIQRAFDAKRARLSQCSGAARVCMMALLSPREADSGPDWLDRMIFNKGTAMDARRLDAALDGLEAIA
mgnify:FL=1